MKTSESTNIQIILDALQVEGLLLENDAKLPSVTSLIAGEVVSGSWWSHRKAQEIFDTLKEIADRTDVLVTKLISGKVTFVHRELWCDVLAIAQAREPWQLINLSQAAQELLAQVGQHAALVSDKVELPRQFKAVKIGEVVRELEKRLLIHTEQYHSKSGAHAKRLESWKNWAARVNLECNEVDIQAAREKLEARIQKLNERFKSAAKPPWKILK